MSKNIRMTQKEISIAQGMDRFLRWCRLRGFAEYSIEFYDEIRMNFALFKDLDAPIEDINKELLILLELSPKLVLFCSEDS